VLPSGMPIKVEVAKADDNDEDEMASVGLRVLELDGALDSLDGIASLIVEKLKAAKPTKATVKLGLAFSVEAGKLTALWVGGTGQASLHITLEWAESPAASAASSAAALRARAPLRSSLTGRWLVGSP